MVALALGLTGALLFVGTLGGVSAQDGPATYAVEQDGDCTEIVPLSDRDRTVEEFYNYTASYDGVRVPFSANTPFGLERANDEASSLFLFEGADGLSLVLIHGEIDGRAGGAASFEFDGLPAEGDWVVRDDPEEESLEHWNRTAENEWSIDWSWRDNYTDGGAFHGGLGDNFEVVIDAAFGADAELPPLTDGVVEDWQALSMEGGSIEAHELDLDQSVTLRSGSCPA